MKLEAKQTSIKSLKEEYTKEYNFITDLLDRVDLPKPDSDSSDSEEDVEEKPESRSEGDTSQSVRAKSLEELHKRLAVLREQKYTYRGKRLKTKIQNKLKRKKKIQGNKIKPNADYNDVASPKKRVKVESTDVKPPKPVFNSNGNLVFSKFDFLGETNTINEKKAPPKERDKKQLLEKLQKNEKYVKNLEETGNVEKANQIKEDMKWKNVLLKAEGIKVKDDPHLLKKSIVKKQSQKKKSEKKWKDRLKTVENQKSDKQKKRKENIEKKLQDKKQKKLKKAKKKGRFIPNA